MTGGAILVGAIDALAPGARLATIGAHGGEQVEIDFIEFFRKHISVHGCGRSTKSHVERVLGLMAEGHLKPRDPPDFCPQRGAGGSRADGEPQVLRPHDHAALAGPAAVPDPLGNFAFTWPFYAGGVIAYLIGALPMGLIVARLFKLGDLRRIGSGNIGATNVLRTGNKAARRADVAARRRQGGRGGGHRPTLRAPTWR